MLCDMLLFSTPGRSFLNRSRSARHHLAGSETHSGSFSSWRHHANLLPCSLTEARTSEQMRPYQISHFTTAKFLIALETRRLVVEISLTNWLSTRLWQHSCISSFSSDFVSLQFLAKVDNILFGSLVVWIFDKNKTTNKTKISISFARSLGTRSMRAGALARDISNGGKLARKTKQIRFLCKCLFACCCSCCFSRAYGEPHMGYYGIEI